MLPMLLRANGRGEMPGILLLHIRALRCGELLRVLGLDGPPEEESVT